MTPIPDPETRVRIVIPDASIWAQGAADSLNGLCGVVTEVRDSGGIMLACVKLDRRPKPWWSHQRPSRSWWLSLDELEIIS